MGAAGPREGNLQRPPLLKLSDAISVRNPRKEDDAFHVAGVRSWGAYTRAEFVCYVYRHM